MIYNFSDAFIETQGPRLEKQWSQHDDIMARRKVFEINEDELGIALENSTCVQMESIGRLLDMPRGLRTMTKDDAVQAIIKTVQARPYYDQKFHDPKTNVVWGMEIIYDVSLSTDHKCPARWSSLWSRGTDAGSKLVCYLLDRFKFMQLHHVPPTCGRKKVNGKNIDTITPQFGSECPAKHVQVIKGGCCIHVEDLVSMNEQEQEMLLHKETFNLMTKEEKTVYIHELKGDMQVLQDELRELASETPGIQSFTMTLMSSLQRGMIRKLSRRFQDVMESTDDGVDDTTLCLDKGWIPQTVLQAASMASKGAKGFLLTLWSFVKQLMGYTWRAVTIVIGGVTTVLKSASEKMAAWMIMSPRSARVFLAFVKTYKGYLCKYLAESVVTIGETSGLLERFKAPAVTKTDIAQELANMTVEELASDHAKSLLAQLGPEQLPSAGEASIWSTATSWLASSKDTVDASASFAAQLVSDSGVNNRIAELVLRKISDNGVLQVGTTFLKRTLGSIPVLGGFAQAAVELTTDAFKDVASDVTEQLFYTNDLTATFMMLYDILDIGECLKYAPKIRSKYPYVLQWIEWIEIQKAKRSMQPNALARVLTQQAEDRAEAELFSEQLKAMNKTPVPAPTAVLGGRSKLKKTKYFV